MQQEQSKELLEACESLYRWLYKNGEGFEHHLFSLICKADSHERAKLQLIFPMHVQAVTLWQNETSQELFFAKTIPELWKNRFTPQLWKSHNVR